MEARGKVRKMTTTKTPDPSVAAEATARTLTPDVPEVLTEEHHEALTRSWEMPAYTRPEAPASRRSRRTRPSTQA